MVASPKTAELSTIWLELRENYRSELIQLRKELDEKALLLEQSQMEVRRLAQRNASITARLQQFRSQIDTMSKPDICSAYEAALDSQQRLFVMRGQLEKSQSEQLHLRRYIETLDQILSHVDNLEAEAGADKTNSLNARTIELLIQAQEGERLRLSRQMHDGPAQSLSNFILQTDIALRLFDMDIVKAREELVQLKNSAARSFQQVRDFIFELRPMMLDDLGLIPTLKRYFEWFKDQSGLEIRFTFTGSDLRLVAYQEVIIFRAIQELLNNVLRHSQASEVKINVDLADHYAKVKVEDNGIGFDTRAQESKGGMGLQVIRERVETLGGSFDIDSAAGGGTRIDFQIPAAVIQVTATSIMGLK